MSVTSGFYNSLNGDRRYNSEVMSAIFDGIISDGVFASIGSGFAVKASTGNTITIGIGRAWFNHKWVNNDSVLSITANAPDVTNGRYDTVIIEVDRNDSVRAASIKIVYGTASKNPTHPTLINNAMVCQVPIAYIYRPANSSSITQDNIHYNVGTEECPYVSGVIDIETVVTQLMYSWDYWFSNIKSIADGDVATNLSNRILNVEKRVHLDSFRGEKLGSSITEAQLSAIRDGSFDGLWLGDYWESDGVKWRIADFDYWYGTGDGEPSSAVTKHHIVIIPDGVLYTDYWNGDSSNTYSEHTKNTNGYALCDLRAKLNGDTKNTITSVFGNNILNHKEYMLDARRYSDTDVTDKATFVWGDAEVEIPAETHVFGRPIYYGSETKWTNNINQIALFRVEPKFIANDGNTYWLRMCTSGASIPTVECPGIASFSRIDKPRGVRPMFAIC